MNETPLLIAVTYTPFTLGVLRGSWGWTLLGLVWSLAIFGATVKAVLCWIDISTKQEDPSVPEFPPEGLTRLVGLQRIAVLRSSL